MIPIVFPATIHLVRIDHEGEGRITFTVPASDLAPVLRSVAALKHVIKVTIEETS